MNWLVHKHTACTRTRTDSTDTDFYASCVPMQIDYFIGVYVQSVSQSIDLTLFEFSIRFSKWEREGENATSIFLFPYLLIIHFNAASQVCDSIAMCMCVLLYGRPLNVMLTEIESETRGKWITVKLNVCSWVSVEGQGKTRALIQVCTSHFIACTVAIVDVWSNEQSTNREITGARETGTCIREKKIKQRAAATATTTAQIRHRNIAFIWLLNKVHFVSSYMNLFVSVCM